MESSDISDKLNILHAKDVKVFEDVYGTTYASTRSVHTLCTAFDRLLDHLSDNLEHDQYIKSIF